MKSLTLTNFRNFSTGQFDFSPGINLLYGPNASGKTNLLEAIHFLSNLRSFRTSLLRELIRWEESKAYLRGITQPNRSQQPEDRAIPPSAQPPSIPTKTLAVEIEGHARTALINSKHCESSREYLQVFPSTAFVPDDLSLVKGSPVLRRYFLDKGTFQWYPPYWSLLTDYNRILRQKNALLRKMKLNGERAAKGTTSGASADDPCEVWNQQLQNIGSKIILRRLLFIESLRKELLRVYAEWLRGAEVIDVQYKSSIGMSSLDHQDLATADDLQGEQTYQSIAERYGQAIQRNQRREHQLGTTLIGPHRDDLVITFAGKALRSYGSQGQQRTAVLALKLAEVQLYFDRYAEYPILLLDDVTSELDLERNTRLFEYLQQGMQVFMSATSKPDFPSLSTLPCTYFELTRRE